MAEIYLALSGELSGFRTLVVVKRILPHLSSNAQFIDMFFDEARIAARLDHPNIARIIEVGQDGHEYFLAMEVVQGRPLSAVLRGAARRGMPLTQAQCGYLVAQAANGLGYAHDLTDADGTSMNVVHRDVSPQNILVSFEGAVKVIDFGVARALGRVTETIPGGLKGKIQYMSPEQIRGSAVDRRSDVFALGVVLWEGLCGRRLFRRDSELETMRAIIDDPIPPPSSITRVSPRLERIVLQALEKDPAKRFQNAADMALALERHAFASEGFSPGQVAASMKRLFPEELARWRRTMAAAVDLEGAPETWTNAPGTFVLPQAIDLRTGGPTVLLRPGVTGEVAAVQLSTVDAPSAGGATPSTELNWLVAPPEPSGAAQPRRRVLGKRGFALAAGLALVGVLGGWLTSRSSLTPVVSPVTVAPPSESVAVLGQAPGVAPPRAESPPATESAIGASASVAEVSPQVVSAQVAPAQVVSAQVVPPQVAPAQVVPPQVAPAQVVPPRVAPAQVARSQEAPGREAPTKPRSRHRRRGRAHESARTVAQAAGAGEGQATAQPNEAPVAAAPVVGTGADELAPKALCTLKLGSQPWAEIWIDGKNTNMHTPYSEEIDCGSHELKLISRDPDLSKTVSITLKPGQVLKRTFALDEP